VLRPGNVQAILSGSNTSNPSLEALPQNLKLKEGQDIVTSGDGGLLPAGLPVGVLTLQEHYPRVRLYADGQTADEVRILDFRSPAEPMPKPSDKDLPAPDKLTPPSPPPASLAQPKPAAATAAPPSPTRAKARVIARSRKPLAEPRRDNPGQQPISAPAEPQATEPPPSDQTDDQDNNQ
jgi:rod shape-determining protein MreC